MDMLSTSEKLKMLLASGLTTVDVARETDITQATISRIATGKHAEPRERSVRAIDALYTQVCAQLLVVADLASQGDTTCCGHNESVTSSGHAQALGNDPAEDDGP